MKETLENIRKHKQERNKMSKEMKIGKASYGGGARTQRKYFKLKDGESVFRILPPLGELADRGIWSVFHKVHYGYKDSQGKLKTFLSSLEINRKNKMVEVPDAADQRIKDLKAKLEAAKQSGNSALVEKLAPLVSGKTPVYNLDSNHYMNVVDLQGNIGVLKIRHRAKAALDAVIKKLRDKGVDPLSVDNGRFFVFSRSGMGLDTTFSVEVYQEKFNVEGVGEVNRDLVHKLSDDLISRLGTEAADLNKLFKSLSAEDIERIVKSSDLMTGQSPVIDELFNSKTAGSNESEEEYRDEEEMEEVPAPAPVTPKATPAPTKAASADAKSTPATTAPKTETKAAPKVTQATPPTTTAEKLAEMSDADFLKELGL